MGRRQFKATKFHLMNSLIRIKDLYEIAFDEHETFLVDKEVHALLKKGL